jgi:hypothetical protein
MTAEVPPLHGYEGQSLQITALNLEAVASNATSVSIRVRD